MTGFMIEFPEGSMDYRPIMVDTLVHHAQTATSGCSCGGVKLGESYPEHVCDMFEYAVSERRMQ